MWNVECCVGVVLLDVGKSHRIQFLYPSFCLLPLRIIFSLLSVRAFASVSYRSERLR